MQTIESLRALARSIHSSINEGVPKDQRIPLGRVLVAIAHHLGLKSWNVAASKLTFGGGIVADMVFLESAVRATFARKLGAAAAAAAATPAVVRNYAHFFEGEADGYQVRMDKMTAALRNIPGVPNATYLTAADGSVFVFSKLCVVATTALQTSPGATLEAVVEPIMRLQQASASAWKAVTHWNISPVPYEVALRLDGSWEIQHRPFSARVPGVYPDKVSATQVTADILHYGYVYGTAHLSGDLVYYGQPLNLIESMDPADLPYMPSYDYLPMPDNPGPSFGDPYLPPFAPGFTPVTEQIYARVARDNAVWGRMRQRVRLSATQLTGDLAPSALVARVHLADLDRQVPGGALPLPDSALVPALRAAFPELTGLGDGTLCFLYGAFLGAEGLDVGDQPIERDETFIFHVLGALAVTLGRTDTIEVGRAVAVGIAYGHEATVAIAHAAQFGEYATASRRLTDRIASALTFLQEHPYGPSRGRPVVTMTDIITRARDGRERNGVAVSEKGMH